MLRCGGSGSCWLGCRQLLQHDYVRLGKWLLKFTPGAVEERYGPCPHHSPGLPPTVLYWLTG
jgi:hypothetical protein